MIEWTDTFDEQIATMSDAELIRAYCRTSAGDATADALLAEIERRGLDV